MCSINVCSGSVQCTITAGSETYIESVCPDVPSCELESGKLLGGSETDVVRMVALCKQPLQRDSHQRNTAIGFQVLWRMPKTALLSSVEAFARKAKCMEGVQPTTVAYGTTSDLISEGSSEPLFAPVGLVIKEPWASD